jgi:hypothetical protein
MFLIPRLEWNEISQSATRTAGNATLSGMASTVGIVAGMIATGTGIPTGATVISTTATSVTLSVNASASGTSVVAFFERYDFQYPPTKDSEDSRRPNQAVATSLSGIRQVQTNFIEIERSLDFGFVNPTDADKLRTNFYVFAVTGKAFRYFQDKDVNSFLSYELKRASYDQVRQVKKHPNFLYSISFIFRRVL